MKNAADAPFHGAHALVFGGAKGIGKGVIQEWARRGARVTIADMDLTAANQTASEIRAEGGNALAIGANVTSDESVMAAVGAAEAAQGQIDILMNNVGAMLHGFPQDIPMAEWQRISDLNYFGTVRAINLVLPQMLARGSGHIVNTASFAGLYPYAVSRIPYAAMKAAIIALSQSLAIYLEPQGIRVSCLMPGPVKTDLIASMTSWSQDCPMRGPGSHLSMLLPEEVGRTLSDGMRDGKIMIPSDDKAWDTIRQWAESPDDFIRGKIDEVARGDLGVNFPPRS